ncbi:hypothetical protein Tco_1346600 [Tanacetum coccineum]
MSPIILEGGTNGVEGGGFDTSPELIVGRSNFLKCGPGTAVFKKPIASQLIKFYMNCFDNTYVPLSVLIHRIDSFTPVEDNIGLLETKFVEEEVSVFVFPEDI